MTRADQEPITQLPPVIQERHVPSLFTSMTT
jgi:hypothetical protein